MTSIEALIDSNIFFYLGLILILLTAIAMTKQIFILDNIYTYSFQSFCLFAMNAALLLHHYSVHLMLSAIIILAFKVIVFPIFLSRVVKKLHIDDQFESVFDVQLLFVALGSMTALSFVIFPYQSLNTLNPLLYHAAPIAVAVTLDGLLLMVNRTKTLSQIMGFLVMENGISLLVLFSTKTLSTVFETALALDLLIGVLIMGIFSNRIRSNVEDLKL